MADANFDASAFIKGLNLADARVQRGARRGMAMLLADGERRAKEHCPIESGTLAGTIVGSADSIKVTSQAVTGTLAAGGGEASDYAIKQHEVPMHHTHPTEGTYASKYIEKAIKELTPKAAPVFADEIKKELGS
jgi:uncharacterized membrane protein YebE (DUF533 family)